MDTFHVVGRFSEVKPGPVQLPSPLTLSEMTLADRGSMFGTLVSRSRGLRCHRGSVAMTLADAVALGERVFKFIRSAWDDLSRAAA